MKKLKSKSQLSKLFDSVFLIFSLIFFLCTDSSAVTTHTTILEDKNKQTPYEVECNLNPEGQQNQGKTKKLKHKYQKLKKLFSDTSKKNRKKEKSNKGLLNIGFVLGVIGLFFPFVHAITGPVSTLIVIGLLWKNRKKLKQQSWTRAALIMLAIISGMVLGVFVLSSIIDLGAFGG